MSQHERFHFRDKAALLDAAERLGVRIPFSNDTAVLFEPIEIAGRKLANRFVVQPMEGRDAGPDGGPGELTFRRYERYAAGGSALIWFEATAVLPEGRAGPAQLVVPEEHRGGFRRLVDRTRKAAREARGGGREIVLLLQLTHSGRYARPDGKRRPVLVRHSPLVDPGLAEDYPLLSDGDLERLADAFVRAAELAADAGFDGVDIKACHGYLVSELLGAATRKESRYGGSFENRIRFLLDVMERIRRRVPGKIVTTRFNAWDGLPDPYGFGASGADPTGVDLGEAAALVQRLEEEGCPLLNVSVGIPYINPQFGRPFNKPLEGVPLPDENPLQGVARLLAITGELQKGAPGLPLVGTGYSWLRQFFSHVGAGAILAKEAALVGIGRGAFAYPDCVVDLEEKGHLDTRKVCVGCSCCSQLMRDGKSTGCVVRDSEIYEPRYREGRSQEA